MAFGFPMYQPQRPLLPEPDPLFDEEPLGADILAGFDVPMEEEESFAASPFEQFLENLAHSTARMQMQSPRGFGQGLAGGVIQGLAGRGGRVASAREKFQKRQEARRLALDEDRRRATSDVRSARLREDADIRNDERGVVLERRKRQTPAEIEAEAEARARGTRTGAPLAPDKPDKPDKSIAQIEAEAEARARGQRRGAPPRTPGDKPATASERQTLGFYQRAKDALDTLTTADDKGRNLEDKIAGQSLLQQARGQRAPGFMQNANQQVYRQAQRQFTEARLRKESGAAISPVEYENDAKIYFVQPGDRPEVVRRKRIARQAVLDGLKFSSGKAFKEFTEGVEPQTSDLDTDLEALGY